MQETLNQYIRRHKQLYKNHCERHNQVIDINIWRNLVTQWKFDFEMERIFQVTKK